MAVNSIPIAEGLGLNILNDEDSDATVEKNQDDGATKIIGVHYDNANAAADKYLKLWFNNKSPIIGTTPEDEQYFITRNREGVIMFPEGADISYLSWATTDGAGTANSSFSGTEVDYYWITVPA